MRRIIVGMTGATGAVIGVELLRQLQQSSDVQTHLVLSRWATIYNHPVSIGDLVDHIVTRILDQFGIESAGAKRWNGAADHKASGLRAVNG